MSRTLSKALIDQYGALKEEIAVLEKKAALLNTQIKGYMALEHKTQLSGTIYCVTLNTRMSADLVNRDLLYRTYGRPVLMDKGIIQAGGTQLALTVSRKLDAP